MEWMNDQLEIDPESTCRKMEQFLKRKLEELRREGILIGLSGGFDSALAAYVSVRAVGYEKVRLLYLPERDSNTVHRRHARLIADELGIGLEERDMTQILDAMGVYELLPVSDIPGKQVRDTLFRFGRLLLGLRSGKGVLEARFLSEADSIAAKANAYAMSKHRLRMALLYMQAEVSNLMVVGAANKTELMTGTFTQWGCDQCADAMPLIHLYRSQLHPLAQYLGLPRAIIEKAADPDIIPGLDDKEELLGSFLEVDQILVGLEKGLAMKALIQSYGEEAVTRVMTFYELSKSMRESPYTLE